MRGFFDPITLIVITGIILGSFFAISSFMITKESLEDVKLLQVPNNIELEFQRYGDKIYKESLRSAWVSALNAKKSAIETSFSISLSKEEFGASFSYDYSKISNYFNQAVGASLKVFDGLNKMLLEDFKELEHIGADVETSNLAHKRYLEIKELFSVIEEKVRLKKIGQEEIFALISPCLYQEITSKIRCTILLTANMKNEKDIRGGANLYNSIVGDDGLLYDYYALHKDTRKAIKDMFYEYKSKVYSFEDKLEVVEGKKDLLVKNEINLIDQDILNQINFKSSGISAQTTGSFRDQIEEISKKIKNIKREKQRSESIYSSEEEDYLFLAIERLDTQNLILSDLLTQLENLGENSKNMEGLLKQDYENMIQSVIQNGIDITNSFYLKALEYGKKAETSNSRGKKLLNYVEALKFLKLAQENNFDLDFSYVEKVLESLKKQGLDVREETAVIEKLKKIDDPDLSHDVYIKKESIIEKLRQRAHNIEEKVEDLRTQAFSYLEIVKEFLKNPALASEFDFKYINKLDSEYKTASSKDILLNAPELLHTYSNIVSSLKQKIDKATSTYLEKELLTDFFFLEIPRCNEFVSTEILISVRNPFDVSLTDIKISKKLDTEADIREPNFLDNSIFLDIDKLEPSMIFQRKLNGRTRPLICSEGKITKKNILSKEIYTLKKNIIPRVKIDRAIIDLELKEVSIISVFPGELISSDEGKKVLLEKLYKNMTLIVEFLEEYSNVTVSKTEEQVAKDYNANTTTRVEYTEKLALLNNQIQKICYFTDCKEIQKDYKELKKKYDEGKVLNFSEIEEKIDDVAREILQNFNGEELLFRLNKIKELKGKFSKAVNTNVDIDYDDSFLSYTDKDLEYKTDEYERLKKIVSFFDKVSLSSNTVIGEFEELISQFSNKELKDLGKDLDNLKDDLNSSIIYLKTEAQSKLMRAGEEYERKNNEEIYDLLSKATKSLEDDYFTRTIIYTNKIHDLFISNPGYFPYEYLLIGGVVLGFTIYLLKKPKKKIEQKNLRRFDD